MNEFPKLSAPALRALANANIKTLAQLSKYTEKEIAALHGIGPNSFPVLRAALKSKKLSFRSMLKKTEIVRGYTLKYHANGKTIWSKGKVKDGIPEGYWEWYRLDGTLKRSGTFKKGEPIGEWTTYDSKGKVYKVTQRK